MSVTKKLVSAALGLTLALTLVGGLVASNAEETKQSQLNYTLEPSCYVDIPATVEMTYLETSHEVGAISVSKLHLEQGKCVVVSLENPESTALINEKYEDCKIDFTVKDSEGNNFTSKSFTQPGTIEGLTINITEEDWLAAASGSYTGTATFSISFADITE